MSKKALLVLERPWDSLRDSPLQLSMVPFFQSLERLDGNMSVYRADFFEREGFRAALDHLMSHHHERSILYVAAHGDGRHLAGNDSAPKVRLSTVLLEIFAQAAWNRNIEGFVLGSCFLGNRGELIGKIFKGAGLRWAVAYTAAVEWLPSALIDMQIVSKMAAASPQDFASIDKMTALFADALSLFNPYSVMASDERESPVFLKDAIRIWVRRSGQGNHGVNDITEQVAEQAWESEEESA